MKQKLKSILIKLKQIYKTSIESNYTDIQDDILSTIVDLQSAISDDSPTNYNESAAPESHLRPGRFFLCQSDNNRNQYYFYPSNENSFKDEAVNQGRIFVRVFHPNGIVEDTIRNVHKKWTTSVFWNINSMYSKHIVNTTGKPCHYSAGHNLTVYACPIQYRNYVPERI